MVRSGQFAGPRPPECPILSKYQIDPGMSTRASANPGGLPTPSRRLESRPGGGSLRVSWSSSRADGPVGGLDGQGVHLAPLVERPELARDDRQLAVVPIRTFHLVRLGDHRRSLPVDDEQPLLLAGGPGSAWRPRRPRGRPGAGGTVSRTVALGVIDVEENSPPWRPLGSSPVDLRLPPGSMTWRSRSTSLSQIRVNWGSPTFTSTPRTFSPPGRTGPGRSHRRCRRLDWGCPRPPACSAFSEPDKVSGDLGNEQVEFDRLERREGDRGPSGQATPGIVIAIFRGRHGRDSPSSTPISETRPGGCRRLSGSSAGGENAQKARMSSKTAWRITDEGQPHGDCTRTTIPHSPPPAMTGGNRGTGGGFLGARATGITNFPPRGGCQRASRRSPALG